MISFCDGSTIVVVCIVLCTLAWRLGGMDGFSCLALVLRGNVLYVFLLDDGKTLVEVGEGLSSSCIAKSCKGSSVDRQSATNFMEPGGEDEHRCVRDRRKTSPELLTHRCKCKCKCIQAPPSSPLLSFSGWTDGMV